MLLGKGFADLDQFHTDQFQALGFKSGENCACKPALNAVRLENDECVLHRESVSKQWVVVDNQWAGGILISSTLSIHIGIRSWKRPLASPTGSKTGCPVFYLEAESFNPPKCKVFHGFHQQVIPSISTDCVEIHPTLTLGYG